MRVVFVWNESVFFVKTRKPPETG
ncbi:MAG: hypothetical protein ACD_3C00172G0008, partial [uncultured bacterium (gcode 4)]